MARTPEELDKMLLGMNSQQQDEFLSKLSDEEFQALADYTAPRYQEGKTKTTELPGGRYSRRPEEMSTAELEAEAAELGIDAPIEEAKVTNPGGFFDTGTGRFAAAVPKGIAKFGLTLGTLPMAVATGSMDPVTAALSGVDQFSDKIGLPKFDQTADDKVVNAVAEGMGSAALFPGAAAGLSRMGAPSGLARTLGANPGLQAVSGATGAASGQIAANMGADPTTQLVAALAGGMAPGGVPAGLRRATRGPSADTVRENIDNFAAAGTTPTVGMATDDGGLKNIEGNLSQSFGSSGRMVDKVNEIENSVGKTLTEKADLLGPEMSNREAGQMILDAQPKFKEGASKMIDTAWDNLEKALPKTTRLDMTKFAEFVNEKSKVSQLGKHLETNPNLSGDQKFWNSIRLDLNRQLKENLARTGEGGLPISVVKKLRSRFGSMLETTKNNDVAADIGAIKQAYGILSEAWKASAKTPQQKKLFDKAMASTKEYHTILDTINPVVEAKGGLLPEAVFMAAMRGTKDGPTLIGTLSKTLKASERQALASQFLRRAAKANPSDPDDFNMSTWATNHTRMDDEAKSVLFGPMKEDLDKIAKAVKTVEDEKLKHGLTNVHNPNMQNLQKDMTRAVLWGGAGYWSTQHPIIGGLIAAGLASKPVVAKNLAKIMTSPKTVHWLARNSNLKKNQIPIAINSLMSQARAQQDPELAELAETLQASMEQ